MCHLPRFLKMHLWLPTFPSWKLCLPGPWQWNLEQLVISMAATFMKWIHQAWDYTTQVIQWMGNSMNMNIYIIIYRSGLYCLYRFLNVLHELVVWSPLQASESQLPSPPASVPGTNPSTPKPVESVASSVPPTPVEDVEAEARVSKEKSYMIAPHFDIQNQETHRNV